jgi:hypothetical protein
MRKPGATKIRVFFCISGNAKSIHDRGRLWKATRAKEPTAARADLDENFRRIFQVVSGSN